MTQGAGTREPVTMRELLRHRAALDRRTSSRSDS